MCKPMGAHKICESSYIRFQKEFWMNFSFSCLNRTSQQFNMGSLHVVLSQWAWLKPVWPCLFTPSHQAFTKAEKSLPQPSLLHTKQALLDSPSYVRCSNPLIILLALCWTDSSVSCCFCASQPRTWHSTGDLKFNSLLAESFSKFKKIR